MILRGSDADQREVEIVNLGSVTSTCPVPARFPVTMFGPVATVMEGKPIVCAGYITRQCYEYSFSSASWSSRFSLDAIRQFASETMLDESTWWITGGATQSETLYHATSVIYDGSTLNAGPNLPRAAGHHCVVRVNASHYFLGGGKSSKTVTERKAHLYDFGSGTWTDLPDMQMTRRGSSCNLFGGDKIFVSGGRGDGQSQYTSEVLSLATLTWSPGPGIPSTSHYCCGSLTIGNAWVSHYAFGGIVGIGQTNDIYMYHPSISQWSTLTKKMVMKTSGHAVIKLPDGIC